MWNRFTQSFPEYLHKKYHVWHFSNNKQSANLLAELVKEEVKKATTSLFYWYDKDYERLPEADEISIITDWDGIAQCIIKTHRVTVLPFCKVDRDMAATEGEGDKSLEYWRKVHISFFSDELKNEPVDFNEDMEVVFEEFEVVYK